MKTYIIIAIAAFLISNNTYSQGQIKTLNKGNVNKDLKYSSDILGYDVHFTVYLPPDYGKTEKKYPVLYLLHGFTGNHKSWIKNGKINSIMDNGIASGEIEPMIIIIPDGKYYWYINDYQNIARYEDFVFEELLPYIDKNYNTIPSKEYRAVAGLSMGGYGTLVWAMQHPDKFSYAVALSASMFNEDGIISMPDQLYKYMSMLYGAPEAKGNDRVTDYYLQYSPLFMAQNNPTDDLRSVNWFIDCGNQDQLSVVNKNLHEIFVERNIEHVYYSRDGGHDWDFWRSGIYDGLIFISDGMRNKSSLPASAGM